MIVAGRECSFEIGGDHCGIVWAASNSRTSVIGIAPSWSTSRSVSSIALPLPAQVPRRIFFAPRSPEGRTRHPMRGRPPRRSPPACRYRAKIGLGALAAVEDERDGCQHRAVRKCRFHVLIVAQCLQQARAWGRDSLRPFAGRGRPRRPCAPSPCNPAIGKHHAIATAMAIDQNAVSRHVTHASQSCRFRNGTGQRRSRACDAAERRWHDLEIAHADKHLLAAAATPSQSRSSRGSLMPEPIGVSAARLIG